MRFGISGIKSRAFKAGLLAGVSGVALVATLGIGWGQYPASQCVAAALAGGTSDAITIPATPCGPTTTLLLLTATATNTTTTPTLQQIGFAAQPIVQADGSAVAIGQIKASVSLMFQNTGSQWKILTQPPSPNTVAYGRIVMVLGPNQPFDPTVPAPTFGPLGEDLTQTSVDTPGTGICGGTQTMCLQEALDYQFKHHLSLDAYCPAAGSPPFGPLQGGNLGFIAASGVSIQVHPLRQQYVHFHGCIINQQVFGPGVILDSGVEAAFIIGEGSQQVNNYTGSLGTNGICGSQGNPAACGILVKPTNPVVPENFVGFQASYLDFGNAGMFSPNVVSDAAVVLDASNGGINYNRIHGKELNCGGPGSAAGCRFDWIERNANSGLSTGIGYNVIQIPYLHLVTSASISIGDMVNPFLYQGEQFEAGELQPAGPTAIGLLVHGVYGQYRIGNVNNAAGHLDTGVELSPTSQSNKVWVGGINGAASFDVLDLGTLNSWCKQDKCSSAVAQVFSSTLNLMGALSSVVGGGNYLCVDPNGLVYKKASCP